MASYDRDLRIWEGLRSDDHQRIRQATTELSRIGYTLARKVVLNNAGQRTDIDDIVQEAIIAVWRHSRAGTYQVRPDTPLAAYLNRIIRNKWLKELRRRRNDGLHAELSEELPVAELPEDPRWEQTRLAFDQLGDMCRRLLQLFYWDGFRLDEIASQLGVTTNAAKERKYRCMLTLSRLLVDAPKPDGAASPSTNA